MRNVNNVETGKTPSGRFKVYVWGQPNDHISNWSGCNYRWKAVDGQPVRGFATREEAEQWARTRFSSKQEASDWAYRAGDGTWMSEEKFIDFDFKSVDFF